MKLPKSQKGFVPIILILILILLTTIGIGAFFYTKSTNLPPVSLDKEFSSNDSTPTVKSDSALLVPPTLSYRLVSSTTDKERIPVLRLVYELGENCDVASQLDYEKNTEDDLLTINIKGYHLIKNGQNPCTPGIITRTEAKIKLEWLKDGDVKKTLIKVGNQTNEFILQRDKYKVSLLPVGEGNMQADKYSYNDPKTTILFPLGITQLYVLGKVDYTKDYREALRNYSRTRKVIPADEIYPGLVQDNPTRFYVKASFYVGLNEDGTSTELGPLPSDKDVIVYISKLVDLGD